MGGLCLQVIDVVGEQLGKKGSVTIDSNFIDDLDADSLDTIELIMSLEEEFGVSVLWVQLFYSKGLANLNSKAKVVQSVFALLFARSASYR